MSQFNGCRFKIVIQCSGCWKYEHSIKFCPSNKKICPKCGSNLDNCKLRSIKCLNCEGAHVVLDKSCLIFLKEKKNRNVMSEESITHRKVLEIYLHEKKNNENSYVNVYNQMTILPTIESSIKPTYNDVVSKSSTKAVIPHQGGTDSANKDKSRSFNRGKKPSKKGNRIIPNTDKKGNKKRTVWKIVQNKRP